MKESKSYYIGVQNLVRLAKAWPTKKNSWHTLVRLVCDLLR